MNVFCSKGLCASLAMLITAGMLVSCGKGNPEDTTSETSTETIPAIESETENLVQEALDKIGEMDYGGQDFTILYPNNIGGFAEEVEGHARVEDQDSSHIINEAVHERNTLFEQRCHLKFTLVSAPHGDITPRLQKEVNTAIGDYQFISQTVSASAAAATSSLLYDYNDFEHIDYGKPWWDQGMRNFSLDGHVFFMDGSFNIKDDDVSFAVIFNKNMAKNHQIGNLYDKVENNEWTMDYFHSLASAVSTDEGNGSWGIEDIYGLVCPESIGMTFFYGAGLRYINNDPSIDQPQLAMGDADLNRVVDVLTLTNRILHENHTSHVSNPGSEIDNQTIFIDGRALFFSEALFYMRRLTALMEDDYGVLPIPKYDQSQEKYTTWTHGIGSTLSIPRTISRGDTEQFGNILLTYAVLSEKLVRPAYYDTVLTIRNVRDPQSGAVLSEILNNRIFDMAIYFKQVSLGHPFFTCTTRNSNAFISLYTKGISGFEKKVNQMLKMIRRDFP